MEPGNRIEIEGNSIELNVDPKDAVIIERHFCKHTKRDLEIRNLPIPKWPIWLYLVVRLIRFYQKYISHRLGNRCVYDPSCSHYAEIAYRKKGWWEGTQLTLKRLARCKPSEGGIDEIC